MQLKSHCEGRTKTRNAGYDTENGGCIFLLDNLFLPWSFRHPNKADFSLVNLRHERTQKEFNKQLLWQLTSEVIRQAHLVVMMSTTHLRIGLLNSVSLGKSSLVRTKLRSILGHITYSLLSELVHLLLSVVASSLFNHVIHQLQYLQDIHQVLLIRKQSSDLSNELTNSLHSLRSMLRPLHHLLSKLL